MERERQKMLRKLSQRIRFLEETGEEEETRKEREHASESEDREEREHAGDKREEMRKSIWGNMAKNDSGTESESSQECRGYMMQKSKGSLESLSSGGEDNYNDVLSSLGEGGIEIIPVPKGKAETSDTGSDQILQNGANKRRNK